VDISVAEGVEKKTPVTCRAPSPNLNLIRNILVIEGKSGSLCGPRLSTAVGSEGQQTKKTKIKNPSTFKYISRRGGVEGGVLSEEVIENCREGVSKTNENRAQRRQKMQNQ